MKRMQTIFLQGFVTVLPLALTIYILFTGIRLIDGLLGDALQDYLSIYIPGLGLLLTFVLIFLFGLLLNNLLTRGLLDNLEKQLTQVPFIKAIYSPLRDLMNLFSKNNSNKLQRVVLVDIAEKNIRALGVVTRERFDDLPGFENEVDSKVSVYIPMSYGLGGFTLLVDKSKLTEVNIPIEKAMSLAITGWVKADKKEGV